MRNAALAKDARPKAPIKSSHITSTQSFAPPSHQWLDGLRQWPANGGGCSKSKQLQWEWLRPKGPWHAMIYLA